MKDTHKVYMNSHTSSLNKLLLFLLLFSLLSELIHKTCRNVYKVINKYDIAQVNCPGYSEVASDNSGHFQISKLLLINT